MYKLIILSYTVKLYKS